MSFLTARLWGCHGGRGSAVGDNGDTAENKGDGGVGMIPGGMTESWGHCGGRGGSSEHDRVMGPPQGTQDSKGDGRAMGPS